MLGAIVPERADLVKNDNILRSVDCGQCRLWVDAVEKGHGAVSVRNNRIGSNDLLNRSCAFDACLESMLRGKPSKIFFQ
jgi:hypothetical protein